MKINSRHELIANIKSVWQTESHKEEQSLQRISLDVINQIASSFATGDFYYYIFNFSTNEMDFVHKNVESTLGIKAKSLTADYILACMHKDDLEKMAEKEFAISEFLFKRLPKEDLSYYKTSYIVRLRTKNGTYKRILHQAKIISYTESGYVHQVMVIHTDIEHLKSPIDHKISFIGINKPNYYCTNPSKLIFTTEIEKIKFTKKETKVIQLISEGKDYNEISSELGISKHTVQSYKKNIFMKAEVKNTAQLISVCVRQGLI